MGLASQTRSSIWGPSTAGYWEPGLGAKGFGIKKQAINKPYHIVIPISATAMHAAN